jgi:hypothetical protein
MILSLLDATLPADVERSTKRIEVDGFEQIPIETAVAAACAQRLVAAARESDEQHVGPSRTQVTTDFETVAVRQPKIEHQGVGPRPGGSAATGGRPA